MIFIHSFIYLYELPLFTFFFYYFRFDFIALTLKFKSYTHVVNASVFHCEQKDQRFEIFNVISPDRPTPASDGMLSFFFRSFALYHFTNCDCVRMYLFIHLHFLNIKSELKYLFVVTCNYFTGIGSLNE